jgi:hypothetical protein
MSADATKIAVYCQGTFSAQNPTPSQQQVMIAAAKGLAASGFGTVLLGQWHVHSDGTLYYNDSPIDTVSWALTTIPPLLRNGVTNVPLTFGPFASDFQGIADHLPAFKSAIQDIISMSNGAVNGLDWDLEGDYEQYEDLLVELTEWATGLGLVVTAAPYTDNTAWTDVLARTNTNGPGFSWWNLQLYGGADYGSWVGYVNNLVPSPQSFLVPGFNIEGLSPSDLQSSLALLVQQYPSIDGGFIWRYEDIAPNGYQTSQYAQAIAAALSGQSVVA